MLSHYFLSFHSHDITMFHCFMHLNPLKQKKIIVLIPNPNPCIQIPMIFQSFHAQKIPYHIPIFHSHFSSPCLMLKSPYFKLYPTLISYVSCLYSHSIPMKNHLYLFYALQDGAPPVISWFINPMNTIVISTINHSYGSYVHQLS